MRKRGPMTCETKADLRKKVSESKERIEQLQAEVDRLQNSTRFNNERTFMPSGLIENVCVQLLEHGKVEPRAKFKTEPKQYVSPELLIRTIEAFSEGDFDEFGDVRVNFTIRHY